MAGMTESWQNSEKVNFKLLHSIIGTRVTVTLPTAIYEGTLIHVEHGQSVMLSNVKDLKSGLKKAGVQLFAADEILQVDLLTKEEKCPTEVYKPPTPDRGRDPALQESYSNCAEPHHASLKIIEKAVEKLDIRFAVIDELQTEYTLAMAHIQAQPVIGVSCAGSNLCRHGNLCWLQVATKSHVYLFDMISLEQNVFHQGLKDVLEDKNIVKVIHDCRGLSDCLYHQYKVALCNVFDTQVADIYLFHKETGGSLSQQPRTLEECLKKHLNMSPSRISFLPHLQWIMKGNQLVWPLHPMPVPLQKALCLEASYVLSLHKPMLQAMMADFTALVNEYVTVYRLSSENTPNWTQDSSCKLPEHFLKLNDQQAKRNAKYAWDQNGLTAQPVNPEDEKAADPKNAALPNPNPFGIFQAGPIWQCRIMQNLSYLQLALPHLLQPPLAPLSAPRPQMPPVRTTPACMPPTRLLVKTSYQWVNPHTPP